MKVIKVKNYDELSKVTARYFIKKIQSSPSLILGLATGSTPEGMYEYMIKDHIENHTSYQNVTSFNLDEYVGLDVNDQNSYRYFMNTHLFNGINIELSNTYVPNGNASNSKEECEAYEQLIKEHGGIDLQLLGIGRNGHIGFNEPGSSFDSRTRVVTLTEKTRNDNARFFESIDAVPTHAITMGMGTILESKEIVMIISGDGKRETTRRLLSGVIDEDFPASALHKHDNVTVIIDEAALADVPMDTIKKYE